MKTNTKSSITLPAPELEVVEYLMKILKAKSKVEVIRKGLALLKESVDRASLRDSFKKASAASRKTIKKEIDELDQLNDEGL